MVVKLRQQISPRGKNCLPQVIDDPAIPESSQKRAPADNRQSALIAYAKGDYRQAALLFWAVLKEQASAECWNDWASTQMALGLVGPAEQGYRRAPRAENPPRLKTRTTKNPK